MEVKDLFVVRPTNEEQNDFIITVGQHLATELHFKTKEDALAYIDEPKWDTIVALCGEMIEAKKVDEQIEKYAQKVVKSIIENTKNNK